MNENVNKQLSVNYGAFSISMQGFEDPFALMRRITDYFQRVAARNPEFGTRALEEDAHVFETLTDLMATEEIEVVRSNNDFIFRPSEESTMQEFEETAVPFVSESVETDDDIDDLANELSNSLEGAPREHRPLRIIRPHIEEPIPEEPIEETPTAEDSVELNEALKEEPINPFKRYPASKNTLLTLKDAISEPEENQTENQIEEEETSSDAADLIKSFRRLKV